MPGGVPGRGSHIRWAKPVSTKKMRSCPEQAYSVGGLMGPISGFHSRGRKRGTCTRGAGVGPRAEGQRSPTAGQAAMAVAPGRGQRAVTGRVMVGVVTGHRGPRATAGGGHKKECPAPCSAPAAALSLLHAPGTVPGPIPRQAVLVRGMGVGAEGRRSPRRGRCDGAGAGAVGPRGRG